MRGVRRPGTPTSSSPAMKAQPRGCMLIRRGGVKELDPVDHLGSACALLCGLCAFSYADFAGQTSISLNGPAASHPVLSVTLSH